MRPAFFVIAIEFAGDLSDQIMNDIAEQVGQAIIAAGVAVREFLMIKTEQVQKRRMEIMYVYNFIDRLESEFVGGSVDIAFPDAAAGDPHAESVMIVVASVHFASI